MSNYSHRGYEHRTGGYGRRRRKASGFRKKSVGGAAVKGVTAFAAVAAVIALVYLFADNILPFVNSFKKQTPVDTPDAPAVQTADAPSVQTPDRVKKEAQGYYDSVDGSIFISDGAGYQKFKGIGTTARNYAAVMNSISSSLPSGIDICCTVIPTNTEFGLDGYLEGSNSQLDNISTINASLSDLVKSVDAYHALKDHEDEYIFYRTDELLTSLGAYYVYQQTAIDANWDMKHVYSISTLSEKGYTISPFEGAFTLRTTDPKRQPQGNIELHENPDIIEYYKLPVHYNCYSVDPKTKERTEFDLFDSRKAAADPLAVFPGKDTPLLYIYNLQSSNTDKLLIVKDHDAEPLIGYLIPHYSEIYVADADLYSGTLHEYINEYAVTDVMFINGISDANNSLYCQRLRDLFDNSLSG